MRGVCFSFIFFAMAGFAADTRPKIDFTLVRQLRPGVMSKEDVTSLLGRPSTVSQVKNSQNAKEPIELWEYVENGSTRLTISFPKGVDRAQSWSWLVYDRDSETDLKTALSRFKDASWKGETEEWINPHAFPAECFYQESKLGITVRYNQVRKEVEAITGWNPSRKVASSSDAKPPVYCIAESCTAASPAKDLKVPVCEVPK